LDSKPSAVMVQCINGYPNRDTLTELLLKKAQRLNVAVLFFSASEISLATLASRVYGTDSLSCRVIGITGTNGKTSCAHYFAQAIDAVSIAENKSALIGTLGNGFYGQLLSGSHTTPDIFTVHRLLRQFSNAGASHVVMEVSSHGLDQGRVDGITFESAVFTNLTQDHLDYHDSMHEYGLAKRKLFTQEGLKVAIVNGDDDYAREVIGVVGKDSDLLVYGCNKQDRSGNYVQASSIELNRHGMLIQVESYKGNFSLQCQLMGRFNASNVLAVCAYLLHSNVNISRIQDAIAELDAVPGRMQLISHPASGVVAVVDYAHTPDALEKAIFAVKDHLQSDTTESSDDLIVVFGCGGDRDPGKRPLMGAVAAANADRIIICDDNPRTESAQAIVKDILAGIASHPDCVAIHDRNEAISRAIGLAKNGDVVLIAGKGHENYQIVGKQKIDMPSDADLARAALSASVKNRGDERGVS